jgi:hypothetical protein
MSALMTIIGRVSICMTEHAMPISPTASGQIRAPQPKPIFPARCGGSGESGNELWVGIQPSSTTAPNAPDLLVTGIVPNASAPSQGDEVDVSQTAGARQSAANWNQPAIAQSTAGRRVGASQIDDAPQGSQPGGISDLRRGWLLAGPALKLTRPKLV